MGLLGWLKSIAGGDTVSYDEYKLHNQTPLHIDTDATDAVKYGLNFHQAIEAHQKWKNRLKAYVDGLSTEELDCKTVGCDNKCILGIWIHSAGEDAFRDHALFHSLVEAHAQFHTVACEIVQFKQAGDIKAAQEMLDGGLYSHLSVKLQGLLAQMYLSSR